jgi:hypothetical protein
MISVERTYVLEDNRTFSITAHIENGSITTRAISAPTGGNAYVTLYLQPDEVNAFLDAMSRIEC